MEANSSFPPSGIKIFKKRIAKGLIVLIILILVGVSIYFYIQDKNAKNLLQNQTQSEASDALLKQVGKLIELPANEIPTIATVSDITKLSDQPFFKNAKNGDKVLIYKADQKAILYRPSTNKIIEVAPVNLGQNQPTPVTSPIVSPTVTPSVSPISAQNAPTFTPTPTQ